MTPAEFKEKEKPLKPPQSKIDFPPPPPTNALNGAKKMKKIIKQAGAGVVPSSGLAKI